MDKYNREFMKVGAIPRVSTLFFKVIYEYLGFLGFLDFDCQGVKWSEIWAYFLRSVYIDMLNDFENQNDDQNEDANTFRAELRDYPVLRYSENPCRNTFTVTQTAHQRDDRRH